MKKAFPRGERLQLKHQRQQQDKGFSKNSASSSGSSSNDNVNQLKTKKIFVGGLSSNVTEEAFRRYFEKFGNITDVVVMYDNVTQRPRGFGFITFNSEEAVENVMQNNFYVLNDKLVEVKRAVPKDGSTCNNGNRNSSYNMRLGNERGSGYGSYEGGFYPPYSPRYGVFHGYAPSPFSGYGNACAYPYGVYPMGGYSGVGYNTYNTPIVPPRGPWNGVVLLDPRRSPLPYGNAGIYPSQISGGVGSFVGVSSGNYFGVGGASNEKWNQNVPAKVGGSYGGMPATMPPRMEVGELDNNASSFEGSCGAAGGNNQSQRGSDGQVSSYAIA